MRVLITGAAGMIGRKLTRRLLRDGSLCGRDITQIHAVDIVESPVSGPGVISQVADLSAPGVAPQLDPGSADVIFHLAGVVSGEAELDFEKGIRVNFDGTRELFEALRASKAAMTTRVVFTSSIAVFGAPFPHVIPDDFHLTPLTSYGTQKAMGELLLSDYSRRGFFDGVGVRLPTISVRPGAPNAAASGFFSGIIREPLAGVEAIVPVPRDVVHTHASPAQAIEYLLLAAALDASDLGARRNLTMPGVAVSVGEQIDALGRVAGDGPVALIRDEPDAFVASIVAGWPTRFSADRARSLGFVPEENYDAIIEAHLVDDERTP